MDSRDPEPVDGSVILDCYGRRWERFDGPYGSLGRANWIGPDNENEHESWVKVAGNYAPVTLIRD